MRLPFPRGANQLIDLFVSLIRAVYVRYIGRKDLGYDRVYELERFFAIAGLSFEDLEFREGGAALTIIPPFVFFRRPKSLVIHFYLIWRHGSDEDEAND